MDREWVPWDNKQEWVLWLIALVIATLFIHNFMRIAKERTGA